MNSYLHQWINKDLYEELLEGVINAPQQLLGMHIYCDRQVFTAYRPCAQKMWVVDEKGKRKKAMEPVGENGFFGYVEEKDLFDAYHYLVQYSDDDVVEVGDPYRFDPVITDFDCFLYAEGNHFHIFDKLGAHEEEHDGVRGVRFAVWAPNARAVSVVGDFNMWDRRLHFMNLLGSTGFYELFIPGVTQGAVYKYEIQTREGQQLYKTDPFGFYAEVRPNTASIVYALDQYNWKDKSYYRKRKAIKTDRKRLPMSIYEVHLGSWRKKYDGRGDGFLTYRESAVLLGQYLVEMGYTHVELMGIAEYPFDGSWGYQVGCYYAPTSRYGTPEDFMFFVEHMHNLGIQVILDWVPAHFPKDAHGLGRFDGRPLYEHPDPRRGEHPDWGTYIFNYGKNEVANFLLANALFWVEKYHIDGLRVDAVASMLYLDYGKEDGQWVANEDGGNENYEAVAFLRHLNEVMEKEHPEAYIIAEESTAWPGVTKPVPDGGLGFTYKWNMGWMNDFTEYMKLDPYFKSHHHDQLCFSITYYLSEQYILVLSHDEVVHGKCSMVNKMPGLMGDKFANLRAAYGFFYGHPGKKLLFMGQEFAQLREWSEERSLDWDLLCEEQHASMQRFIKDMNHLYYSYNAFYYNDNDMIGFEWMDCQSWEKSTLAFVRRGKSAKKQLMFVLNFTPVDYPEYTVKAPCGGEFMEILNSDDEQYGGGGRINTAPIEAYKKENGWEISLHLPPCSVVIFQYDYRMDTVQ